MNIIATKCNIVELDVDIIVNDFGECFAYDESLVTFNSPDIENQYNNINKNTKLRIIGILKSNPLLPIAKPPI